MLRPAKADGHCWHERPGCDTCPVQKGVALMDGGDFACVALGT